MAITNFLVFHFYFILTHMYLAVDIGGTKTLVAAFSATGELIASSKFPTPKDYDLFLQDLALHIDGLKHDFRAGVVAAPGRIDRQRGVVIALGNLKWKNIPLAADVEKLAHCPISIENDTKLAGLSEAINIKDEFSKVLYVTISTGISSALTVNGVLDPDLIDSESGHMLLEHDGKVQTWESFASGKAIVKKYGKRASDITSESDWKTISRNISIGLIDLIAVIQPEVIVIGGGVGSHFHKYKKPLTEQLKKYEMPMVPIPKIRGALKAEEAVIYGCYHLAKSLYGHKLAV
jgi:predicted NBD/HSP70 family sugar kinase